MSDSEHDHADSGFAWHVHHDQLVEWCWSFAERRAFILAHKPMSEQHIRLTRLRPVRAPLGDPTLLEAYTQAREAKEQAWEAYEQAWEASIQAQKAYELSVPPDALAAAHAEECPGCPWDGKTLFPEVKE